MGNSNSNFNTAKNADIINKLKNLLAESEAKPQVMTECNEVISKLKTLIEESETQHGHSMTNDIKVDAVTGDTEPEVVAAEVDILAVDMPSHSVFESTEKSKSNMMDMSIMEGGAYIIDNLKNLLGAANNTERIDESNEMDINVNNLKQLLANTEEEMYGGNDDDNMIIEKLKNLLDETESYTMMGGQVGEINNVTIQHLRNLLAETETFNMTGGAFDDASVQNLKNLLAETETNFNYHTVNLRGGKVHHKKVFTSEEEEKEIEEEMEKEKEAKEEKQMEKEEEKARN